MLFQERDIVIGERRHPATKWTIEIMTGAIVGLKENGEPVNWNYLLFTHSRLAGGIINYPGGWKHIVSVAGYNPDEETAQAIKMKGGEIND